MASEELPEPPAQLRAIQSYMKIAADIERVNPVVAYWVRLHSTSTALSIDKDSPECKAFLGAIIVWLEKFKQNHKDDEAVTNETVGQAHYENFVVALFNKADTLDRDGSANKNTVKMFYMAAVLFEAMAVFGPLTDEVSKRAKYAKFKAAYIQKCLKSGITPKPGPVDGSDLEDPTKETPQPGAGGNSTGLSDPFGIPSVPDDLASGVGGGWDKPNATVNATDPFIMNPSQPPPLPKPVPPPPVPSSTPNKPSPSSIFDQSANKNNEGSSTISATKFHATNGAPLKTEDLLQSQRYCKFANSALQYDDIPTAVMNLEKALKLLKTGQE